MAKAHEYVALLIPQTKGEGFEARHQCDRLNRLEEGVRLVTQLKMIVRNARTEVMNMVKSNIACKPLQDSRQFIERTALKRRCGVVPILGARPISPFELMLNVE